MMRYRNNIVSTSYRYRIDIETMAKRCRLKFQGLCKVTFIKLINGSTKLYFKTSLMKKSKGFSINFSKISQAVLKFSKRYFNESRRCR